MHSWYVICTGATSGGFVRPVGVRSAAGLVPSTGTVDFFQALDAYLKQHQVRLRDVFTQFDTKGEWPRPEAAG